MKPTLEQRQVIESEGNVKVNAAAGTGKTSTLAMMSAQRREPTLFLVFNKQNKEDAGQKFASMGLDHVKVATNHSMAYQWYKEKFKIKGRISLNMKGFSLIDLIKEFDLNRYKDSQSSHFKIAFHIKTCLEYYCNSSAYRISDVKYEDFLRGNARTFFLKHQQFIYDGVARLMSGMKTGDKEPTYDYLLKVYQLSKPRLPYKNVLLDEGQDSSDVMLDVFLNQDQARKVIVGDEHQSIYSWRYAVNALSKVSYPTLLLSGSFRFGERIAEQALSFLSWKRALLGYQAPITLSGLRPLGSNPDNPSEMIICRTNSGLFNELVKVLDSDADAKFYIEGNNGDLFSYMRSDNGISIMDLVSIHRGQYKKVKHPALKAMLSMEEVKDYGESTGDMGLLTMIKLVNDYGHEILDFIDIANTQLITSDQKHRADVVLSTVHKSKGLEYDYVHIGEDFLSFPELMREVNKRDSKINVNEEINLLYVGVTRSKGFVSIPKQLMTEL